MSARDCVTRRVVRAVVSAGMLIAAAGAAMAETAADWAQIEAAARQEGKVVFYTSSATEDVPLTMKKFQERYGITKDEAEKQIKAWESKHKH